MLRSRCNSWRACYIMKTCFKCKKTEPEIEFGNNRARKDGKQVFCRECQRLYCRLHYVDNKQQYSVKRERIRNRNRKFIFNYLTKHGCVDCPETDPIVLTFDHVRGKKKFNLAEAASHQYSIKNIEAEIMKCKVRCFNCHARKTAKDFGWYSGFLQQTVLDVV